MHDGGGDPIPARERILSAVLALLDDGGVEAVSTRAVGARAGVQAPAIYRLFGDKHGLLQAAAERGYADWVRTKGTRSEPEDPVEALREGWDRAVEFGLAHPALFRLRDAPGDDSPAFARGRELLRGKLARVAAAGRLLVTEDQAATLLQSAGRGITLALIDVPPEARDPALQRLAREAVIAVVAAADPGPRRITVQAAALTLRALLPGSTALRPAEQALLREWLDRIGDGRA